jgi:hypothetical protein
VLQVRSEGPIYSMRSIGYSMVGHESMGEHLIDIGSNCLKSTNRIAPFYAVCMSDEMSQWSGRALASGDPPLMSGPFPLVWWP